MFQLRSRRTLRFAEAISATASLVLALLATATVGCSAQKAAKQTTVAVTGPQTINCAVQRRVCAREQLNGDGTVGCAEYTDFKFFNSTICTLDAMETLDQACNRAFCTRATASPQTSYDYLDCVTKGGIDLSLPNAGLCQTLPAGAQRASILYLREARRCVPDPTGQFCASFEGYPQDNSKACFDLSERTAIDQLVPPSDARDGHLLIQRIVLGAPFCNPGASTQSALTYSLPASSFGTVVGGGLTVPLKVTQGTARVLRSCSAGTCQPTTLASFQARLADTTVAGVPLTNLTLRSRGDTAVATLPDPDGPSPGFNAGTLSFALEGLAAGVPSRYVVGNDGPVLMEATSSAFNLRGDFHIQDVNSQGRPLFVEVPFNLNGTPASSTTSACAAQTSLQRLFGFETAGDWTSGQAALSTVSSPLTQGCAALAVAGQNYMTIDGRPFANTQLVVQPAASVDLFVPSSQPNPYWTGALQLYLTCPSRAYYNQFMGQVELTGKPQNAFSTMRFPLPTSAQDALRQASDDCRFSFALNVNPTGRTWILDNLRLTP